MRLISLALTVLVASTALAGGPSPDLDAKDPKERRRAVGKLEGRPGLRALRSLLAALGDEDGSVRERAASILSRRREEPDRSRVLAAARRDPNRLVRTELAAIVAGWPEGDAVACLRRLLGDRVSGVRAAAARGLGDHGAGAEVSVLETLLRDRAVGPRIAALESLDLLDPSRSTARARAALADREGEMRVAAVHILSRRRDEEADRALIGRLDDSAWSVRVAAARSVATLRLAPAIPLLIEALEREEGRVREEMHRALAAVTGVGLPDDPARWRAWWDRVADGFEVPTRPARPPEDETASAVTYHSIPVTSRRVAFLIDASRSMLRTASGESGKGPSRRERALGELESTLRRLPGGTRFNLVMFGRETVRWQERARPVGPAAIRDAVKQAQRTPAGGWTDLYGAIRSALQDRTVDTIYVLTDGAPSAGRYTARGALLAAIARLNRNRLVRIHTVGFAVERVGKRWRGFLAALARAHGGVHVAR